MQMPSGKEVGWHKGDGPLKKSGGCSEEGDESCDSEDDGNYSEKGGRQSGGKGSESLNSCNQDATSANNPVEVKDSLKSIPLNMLVSISGWMSQVA